MTIYSHWTATIHGFQINHVSHISSLKNCPSLLHTIKNKKFVFFRMLVTLLKFKFCFLIAYNKRWPEWASVDSFNKHAGIDRYLHLSPS
jgi:hypothetical protein